MTSLDTSNNETVVTGIQSIEKDLAFDNQAYVGHLENSSQKPQEATTQEDGGGLGENGGDTRDQKDSIRNPLRNYPNIMHKASALYKCRATIISITLAVAYTSYVIAVLLVKTESEKINYWCDSDGLVVVITGLLFIGFFYFLIIQPFFASSLNRKILKPVNAFTNRFLRYRWAPWIMFAVLVAGVLTFIGIDSRNEPIRLQSLVGLVVILFFGFITSAAPRKVRWRHVAWGITLQFFLGLLILRWPLGEAVFECLSGKVSTFLNFTSSGADFVFGKLATEDGIFAFSVLPVTLFFSFCIQILYYFGAMQWVVVKLGWCLQATIGTTACESVNAAANIFLGQTEAPLLIKPFLSVMTKSELHAVMTGGFATIAGSVLAAYISFGVDPAHLISASIMNAPAALAFSKLFYPETEQSRTTIDNIKIDKGEETNWLHAAMVGVTNAIPLVANIAANLIAFIAFIALFNHIFDWGCILLGTEEGVCSLEKVFGYIFTPLAWVMGVEWSECGKVGELIGIKIVVNEFVAYSRLADMMDAQTISKRAEIIATYALCGFSNISSIGINLGGFSAMAPSRRADLAKVVVRAMIAGSCACFLTASIAGTLLSVGEEPAMYQRHLDSLPTLRDAVLY